MHHLCSVICFPYAVAVTSWQHVAASEHLPLSFLPSAAFREKKDKKRETEERKTFLICCTGAQEARGEAPFFLMTTRRSRDTSVLASLRIPCRLMLTHTGVSRDIQWDTGCSRGKESGGSDLPAFLSPFLLLSQLLLSIQTLASG